MPLYENLKKAKKGFEVIYVSFDKDERDWQTYSKSMPWVSLPYDDERRVELRKLFDVQGKIFNWLCYFFLLYFHYVVIFWCLNRYSHTDSDGW